MNQPIIRALAGFLQLLIVMMIIIFVPAWTLDYWQAWIFLAAFFVPALAITGVSGFRMAGASTDPRIVAKRRRMPIVAANGIRVLIPAALYLATLASRGDFGPLFYGVQAIELVAGAVNLTLMSLNIRDGLSLTARRRVREGRPGNFQRT